MESGGYSGFLVALFCEQVAKRDDIVFIFTGEAGTQLNKFFVIEIIHQLLDTAAALGFFSVEHVVGELGFNAGITPDEPSGSSCYYRHQQGQYDCYGDANR